MKMLITGANGQLGAELQKTAPAHVDVMALAHADCDITDAAAVQARFAQYAPHAVINCAAYTAVDKAQAEAPQAMAVNAKAAGILAKAAQAQGAWFAQVSTDFVFDGKRYRPYPPEAGAQPLSVYGVSKYTGEQLVLAAKPDAFIVRTAWVYSAHGHNFVKTMLRLMRERGSVNVIADQIGTPTWAQGLAGALWRACEQQLTGTYHWTDAGVASWYDFAVAIAEEAVALGLLDTMPDITPLKTEDYPTPAVRPPYSVLDKTSTWQALGIRAPHWRVQLRAMLAELKP